MRFPRTKRFDAVASLVMHAAKSATYQQQLELSSQFWSLAALMGVAMILGTYLAKGILKRVSPETFQCYTALLLVVIVGYMVVVGSSELSEIAGHLAVVGSGLFSFPGFTWERIL